MQTSSRIRPILKIVRYTVFDEVRQKSLLALFLVCILFVFFSRGCYQGSYVENGQALNSGIMTGVISNMVFHGIASGMLIVAGVIAMRAFRRDREEGMLACILSKPIARWQYVAGKVVGLWVLGVIFMFILHGMVFMITSYHLKIFMPVYLAGSLLCTFNLLFIILAVLLLSLLMPDIVAFLCVLGVMAVSFIGDGVYAIIHSSLLQPIMQQPAAQAQAELTWKHVVYYAWPKLAGTEQMASALISHQGFHGFGSVYPLINIIFYCLVLVFILGWCFRHAELT